MSPDTDSVVWRAVTVAPLAADGWDPDDMLLLPLRGGSRVRSSGSSRSISHCSDGDRPTPRSAS